MKSAIDLDRVARNAQREVERTNQADADAEIDFYEMMLKGKWQPPIGAGSFHVLAAPRPPKKKVGALYVPDDTVKAQQVQITCARILEVGPEAMNAVTTSGIKLKNFYKDIQSPEQLVGRYVIHQRYAGQQVDLLDYPGRYLLYLTVDVLSGPCHNPDALLYYI